jgi:hypothetical protein
MSRREDYTKTIVTILQLALKNEKNIFDDEEKLIECTDIVGKGILDFTKYVFGFRGVMSTKEIDNSQNIVRELLMQLSGKVESYTPSENDIRKVLYIIASLNIKQLER